MKTSLKKNKKFWSAALAVIVSISCILGLWSVVYAQEQKGADTPTSDKAVQTEVEVNVKYIFEDEKVFKEEKIKAEKGQLLDSGDLPMLSDDMKFIDEFLFYEVKGDGKDEIIRKVAKIEVKDNEIQSEEGSFVSDIIPNVEEGTLNRLSLVSFIDCIEIGEDNAINFVFNNMETVNLMQAILDSEKCECKASDENKVRVFTIGRAYGETLEMNMPKLAVGGVC